MGHLGSKKRERAREKRAARPSAQRSRPPEAVAQATGLSGTYCPIHGTHHSPDAAVEMGCFE